MADEDGTAASDGDSSKLFRQEALDQLSSPDQLDQLMRLSRPISWLALVSLLSLVVASALWSAFGSLSVTVDGNGILLKPGGLQEVFSVEAGEVESIAVGVGDRVSAGQVLVTLRRPALKRAVSRAESVCERQARRLEELETTTARRLNDLRSASETKRDELESAIRALRDLGGADAKARLADRRVELADLDLDLAEAEATLEAELRRRRQLAEEAQAELALLVAELDEQSTLPAPVAGRVVEVLADPGDLLPGGSRVIALEPEGGDIAGYLFVPVEAGRTIEQGMSARIRPLEVQRKNNEFLAGEVTRVADYPTSRNALMRLLANDSYADTLLRQGPSVQVEIRLSGRPLAAGPAMDSGTLVTGNIVVDRDRPLAYIIPGIESLFGR